MFKAAERKKPRAGEEQVHQDLEAMLAGRKKLVAVSLKDLYLPNTNHRFGQKRLDFDSLLIVLERYKEQYPDAEEAPGMDALTEFAGQATVEKITGGADSVLEFCDNLITLANSFIDKPDGMEQPPKVYPLNEDRKHEVAVGARRCMAAIIASVFGGQSSVDVVVVPQSRIVSEQEKAISRFTENYSREDATGAEMIYAMHLYLEAYKLEHDKYPRVNVTARQIGMERTYCGRLFKICKQGAGEREDILYKLHDAKISDVRALERLFHQPESEWSKEADLLIEIGPSQYRSLDKAGEKDELSEARQDEEIPSLSEPGEEDSAQYGLGEGAQPSAGAASRDPVSQTQSSGSKAVQRETGVQRLLELIEKWEPELVEGLEGKSAQKVLDKLLERLAEYDNV